MINPYNNLPRDKGGEPMQEFPAPKLALARYAPENAAASSVITVNADTTSLEVAAIGASAVLRWVPPTETAAVGAAASVISAAGTANFDHVIPVNTIRRFAIPIYQQLAQYSIVGANAQNGLYNRVAYKSVGAASVLVTEYGN